MAAGLVALRANGVVPTLKHGDTAILEKVANALYLGHRFAEKGLAHTAR